MRRAAAYQAAVLTNVPLEAAPPPCRLLASVVRNCCSVAVVELDELLDAPSADSRFWKSLVSVLVLDDVPVEVEALVVDDVDASVELVPDVSDCARFAIADARSLP
ncbi:conserved protein of unknown function [Burkholderia multivorans]